MPNLPFRRRHGDPADEQQLDALLEASNSESNFDATFVANFGASDLPAPAPEWQSVSDLLRAAASAGSAVDPSERASEAAVLAAFRHERAGNRHRQPQTIARYKTMLSTRLSALRTGRLAAGLVAGVVTLTGAATAAYACVLPSPIQNFAHDTIGAPLRSGSGSGNGSGSHQASTAVLAADAVKADDSQEPKSDKDDPSSPAAVPTVTPTPTPTNTAAAAALAAKKAAAEAAEATLKQKLVVYQLCREFATASAVGKTLDPKSLAALVKAAGTAAGIPAFCAALPVLPTTCPTVSSTATPTAMATATADPMKKHWGPWCGVCPQVKATATATPTATASATPMSDPDDSRLGGERHGQGWAFGLWCGGLGDGHHVDPKVIPLPSAAAGLDSRHDGGDQGHGQGNGQGPNHH